MCIMNRREIPMKILIVEDSLFVQSVLRKVLYENFPECEILTAQDGKRGYLLYREQKPDVITTDLLMPIWNGQEMLTKIRAMDTKTPVIVISADVQKATKEEVYNLGIVGFINKPITSENSNLLIELIKEAFNVK